MIVSSILSAVKVEETVSKFLNQSVQQVCEPVRETMIEKVVPSAVTKVLKWGAKNVESILNKLHLAEIVQQEVSTFSTERLEDLVLSITKNELKNDYVFRCLIRRYDWNCARIITVVS